jgi:hypothetical protein
LFLSCALACEKVSLGLVDDVRKVVKKVIGEHWHSSFFIVKVAAAHEVSSSASVCTLPSSKRASRVEQAGRNVTSACIQS